MKVVAFIPIKTNNERLPGKNTKCFSNGRPLISYILETVCKVDSIDEIYVYCSDTSIKQFLPQKVKFLLRDKYLDLSTTSFNEVLTTFKDKIDADIYVLTHATAPFIEKNSFEKAINAVKQKYDSAFSVKKIQEFLWKDNKPFNYDTSNIPRTQDLEPIYAETCGLYVYRKSVINNNKRIGENPFLLEVSEIEAQDINNPNDFLIADEISKILEK